MAARQSPNRLLANLPARDYARFTAGGSSIVLEPSHVLATAGTKTANVYFPVSGAITIATGAKHCPSLQVGMLGCEGMLGGELALGSTAALHTAIVQGGGKAWCFAPTFFMAELAVSAPLRKVTGHYLYAAMLRLTIAAQCAYFHAIEARLACWLLARYDRATHGDFYVTHEALAQLLGVRRVGITNAASSLQRQGLIHYVRGHLTVSNRAGLEAVACGCYRDDQRAYLASYRHKGGAMPGAR